MYTLVDLYFETAYNASLLLHKQSFLEQLALGTATPHIVLSVCAWAAKFVRIHFSRSHSIDNLDIVSTATIMACLP
jgi:hypothetical protein